MMKIFFPLFLSFFLFVSCNNEQDPYRIAQNRVGLLTNEAEVRDLDSIFANDSVVKQLNQGQFSRNSNEIKVYDTDGTLLLLLEPIQAFDSTSTIGYIRVMDPRFETAKGLNSQSTFSDIVENYTISRIENTLRAAVVFIDELNLYITIDKKELPAELRYNTQTRIQASQIPDDASFKYFMINWD